MPVFVEHFKIPPKANLSTFIDRSKKIMTDYKATAFQTAFLKEVMEDKFEYTGSQANTILVQDTQTKEPAELKVDYEISDINPKLIREDWYLYNSKGDCVGMKYYAIEKLINSIQMRSGSMTTLDHRYKGIGTRLDQIQIERALHFGLEKIPRTAQPQAVYYHAMMGYLPINGRLYPVENNLEEAMQKAFYNLDEIDFEPVLVEKDGKIFIDCNKTLANANLNNCKKFCKENQKGTIKKIEGKPTTLELSGDELNQWKEIIRNHSLLDKFNFTYANFNK